MRDLSSVAALIGETVKDFGPIRGIVHGAGVLADKLIAEKTSANVDSVLDTKLAGLRLLLDAVKPADLRVLALFLLVHRALRPRRSVRLRRRQRGSQQGRAASGAAPAGLPRRGAGLGPVGRGMVDAGLKKLFASEGVGVIGLDSGARHLASELRAAGAPAETVVIAAAPGAKAPLQIAFERDLSLDTHPFLASHVINGRAVVPLAASAEWLAHGALHANPGLVFAGFDDLRVTKAIPVLPGREDDHRRPRRSGRAPRRHLRRARRNPRRRRRPLRLRPSPARGQAPVGSRAVADGEGPEVRPDARARVPGSPIPRARDAVPAVRAVVAVRKESSPRRKPRRRRPPGCARPRATAGWRIPRRWTPCSRP